MNTSPNEHSITPVFGAVTEELRREVAAFWLQHGAIGNLPEAVQRADQLLCVARNGAGEIVGVNTAYLARLPGRDGRYFFCRMFIRPRSRVLQLAYALARAGIDTLRQHRHREAGVRGAAVVAENPKFARAGGRRYLSNMGWRPAGKDLRGLDLWTIEFEQPGSC
jgi:hypothetical protein